MDGRIQRELDKLFAHCSVKRPHAQIELAEQAIATVAIEVLLELRSHTLISVSGGPVSGFAVEQRWHWSLDLNKWPQELSTRINLLDALDPALRVEIAKVALGLTHVLAIFALRPDRIPTRLGETPLAYLQLLKDELDLTHLLGQQDSNLARSYPFFQQRVVDAVEHASRGLIALGLSKKSVLDICDDLRGDGYSQLRFISKFRNQRPESAESLMDLPEATFDISDRFHSTFAHLRGKEEADFELDRQESPQLESDREGARPQRSAAIPTAAAWLARGLSKRGRVYLSADRRHPHE